GRFTSPFNSLAAFNAEQGGAAEPDDPEAGDYIFVYEGAGPYDGGIALLDDQTLVGQGVDLIVSGTTLVTATAPPTLTNATGDGITLAEDNAVHGLVVGNTSGTGIVGSGIGTLDVSSVSVTGTGAVLDLAGGTVN